MATTEAVEINLDYRPASYFWPHGLATHLLARVKGAARKAALKDLIDAGRLDEVFRRLTTSDTRDEAEGRP